MLSKNSTDRQIELETKVLLLPDEPRLVVIDSNGPHLAGEYMMSSCNTPHVYSEPEAWELDFATYMVGSVPSPCMFNNKMFFRGALNPTGSPHFDEIEKLIIFSPVYGYKLIDFKDLKPITNELYFKYYKPLYEHKFVRCETRAYKFRKNTHVILGNKRYLTFKGE